MFSNTTLSMIVAPIRTITTLAQEYECLVSRLRCRKNVTFDNEMKYSSFCMLSRFRPVRHTLVSKQKHFMKKLKSKKSGFPDNRKLHLTIDINANVFDYIEI